MKKKIFFALISLVVCTSLLCACVKNVEPSDSSAKGLSGETKIISTSYVDFSYTERDLSGDYDEASATKITLNDNEINIDGKGASASNGNLVISSEGTYIVSGTLSDGQIIVDAGDADKVQIVLCGVNICCSTSCAINIKSADKVFITLASGTQNTVSDAESYLLDENDEPSGAIFSKCDLTINGNGALSVTANFLNGIHSKDDLVITDGTITVTAKNDALKGRDCVAICGGNITLISGGDGIQSNNDEDSAKGFVTIDGGTVNISSELDGIQAETILQITGGEISLTSGGGAADGVNAEVNGTMGMRPDDMFQQQGFAAADDTESQKGLKAITGIYIIGGTLDINSADDSIHSNGDLTISDGMITASSGDDGIHADSSVTIDGGTININNSYEGVEGKTITINGGTVSVNASDDGFNAAGGQDGSSLGGRPGENAFASDDSTSITINGGYIYIAASGDGIDSNGALTITGGTTLVDGPTNNGNGALDYAGTATISGGTLVAAGSYGMAQNLTGENQSSLLFVFSSNQEGGTPISLFDSNGGLVVSYTPSKAYQCVIISTPSLKTDSDYSVATGGVATGADVHGFTLLGSVSGGSEITSFTLTESSQSVSDTGAAVSGGMGGMGDMGGMQPPTGDGFPGGEKPTGDMAGQRPQRG